MPYRVHHIDAVILSSRAVGESDREYQIFSREHGLLRVRARSIRRLSSKLRYACQTFHHVRMDVVRGRSGWKMASATFLGAFPSVRKEKMKRVMVSNAFRILRRLIHIDEPVSGLFDDILGALAAIERSDNRSLRAYEIVLASRILHSLGYWPTEVKDAEFLSGPIGEIKVDDILNDRVRIASVINASLRQTHL